MRIIAVIALYSLAFTGGIFAEGYDKASVLSLYNTDNTIIKRKALRKLSAEREFGKAVAQWKKDLLRTALQEVKPTVVETAVREVRYLNLTEFNNELVSLYRVAESKFANLYSDRVRNNIVQTLAVTGQNDAQVYELFKDALNPANERISLTDGDILDAIKGFQDAKYREMVQQYKAKIDRIEAEKKAQGIDPLRYSIYTSFSTSCAETLAALK